MTAYISPPSVTDPDDLSQEALDYLSTNIPGFTPRDGHLEVWMIQALAQMCAEAQDVASAVPTTIFRYFGQNLLGLQPINAVSAEATTTWTMIDNQGYTIPSGTTVAYRTAGDELVAFVTTNDYVVPPGVTATDAGVVPISAVEPGAAGNGLGPAGLELVDALAFVDSVVAVAATSGGIDAETDEQYLGRLIDDLRLLTPRPILAADFAVLAKQVGGVQRAVAVDNYNPLDDTSGNERMVAVAVVDADGLALPAPTITIVQDYLDGLRETNFVVHVFSPTYTAIAVDFTAVAYAGFDTVAVHDAAIQAVTDYLSPKNWGLDPGDNTLTTWTNDTVVRYLEVAALLNSVEGLRHLTALSVNGGIIDVPLAGEVALPTPGAITGVVN